MGWILRRCDIPLLVRLVILGEPGRYLGKVWKDLPRMKRLYIEVLQACRQGARIALGTVGSYRVAELIGNFGHNPH